MDFTIIRYIQLIKILQNKGFSFQTFEEFIKNPILTNCLILRHDVDRLPEKALKLAKIENILGIKASYYFRIVNDSNRPEIIRQISELKHEIGYHYEDLALARGNLKIAITTFENNLQYFRKFSPVKTISMHGSPLSKWDNKDIWIAYDYKDYGVIAEPYFDVNFDKVFYITDSSRSWNNTNVSLRDKVKTRFHYRIKSSNDIIDLLKRSDPPKTIMINIHPHNWSDNWFDWIKVLIWQQFKNMIKRIIIEFRKHKTANTG